MKMTERKDQVLVDLKKRAELTTGMLEFVIKIDMNLDAPIVNTGCVIPVNNGKFTQLWAIVNMEEYGSFIPAEGLHKVQEALTKSPTSKTTLATINKVCHTAVCVPFVPAVTIDMLRTPEVGDMIMAIHLMNGYLKSPYNRLHGREINYCHFASRCHIYFNGYPAGLMAGTNIEMAGNKFTPHKLSQLKPENKVYLVNLIPKRKELLLVTGSNQQFEARTEAFAFPEPQQLRMSELAATVTEFLAIYETQCKQIIDATAKKTPSRKTSKNKK